MIITQGFCSIMLKKFHKWTSIRLMSTQETAQAPTPNCKGQTINVDQQEVDRLGSLSKEWWDEKGPMKPLHSMNRLRVPLVRDGLVTTGVVKDEYKNTSKVLKDLNILEVGCGGGILTEALARIHANVTGIDPGDRLVNVAKEHLKADPKISDRIQYLVETVEAHSIRNQEKYDAVIASEVLEHVQDKVSFLQHCVMALKPGGSIFITTLNKTTLAWLGGIVAAEYIIKLLPQNTHDWEKFISPIDTERILASFNCTPVLVHGMTYDFLRDKWCWSQCTEINYAIHAVKNCEEVKNNPKESEKISEANKSNEM